VGYAGSFRSWYIQMCGGWLTGEGADTTSATLNSFILGVTVFPQAMEGAHEELDRVVGPNRLPTFEDEENLPYIRAMVKETLRWRPVAVLGGTVALFSDIQLTIATRKHSRRLLRWLSHPQGNDNPG
jgi:cytochrome P450